MNGAPGDLWCFGQTADSSHSALLRAGSTLGMTTKNATSNSILYRSDAFNYRDAVIARR